MSVSINAICRKDRINQNRTTNIYLRFTVNRRSRYVSTGINIPADDWDFDTQTLKTQNPAVQLRIYEQIEKYDKRIKRLEALEVPVTLDNVLETDGRRVYCTIAEYFRRTITQLESVGKIGSASKHKVTFSLLQQFRSTNIRFDEITVGYLRDFELFLMKKGNKSNSIATKFSVLKAVYNKGSCRGNFHHAAQSVSAIQNRTVVDCYPQTCYPQGGCATADAAEIPADGSAYLVSHGTFSCFPTSRQASILRTSPPCVTAIWTRKESTMPAQNQQGDDLPPLGTVESDYRQIRQIRPCGRGLYFPDTRPPHTQDRATDLRPSTQGAETCEQGPARVEPIIGAENRTDYLCRSAHVRNGLEAFGSEYCHHFRIARSFRFIVKEL